MFWGTTYSLRSEIDRLLEEGENDEPVTLERLFAEPTFSSELRTNVKLQDYLALPTQLLKVIKYAFLEPSQELIFDPSMATDNDGLWGPKTPSRVSVTRAVFVSSDVLSINSVSITQAIIENEKYIDEILFPPLSKVEGVSPLVAERLFKFVERLFSQKRDELNLYLKPRWSRLFPLLISSFRNQSVVDLTLYLWMIADPLHLDFSKNVQTHDFNYDFIGQILDYLFLDTEEQEFTYRFILDLLNFPFASTTEIHPAANLVNILMNPCVTHRLLLHLCNKDSSQATRLNIVHVLSQLLQWPPSQDFGISELSRQNFIVFLLKHLDDLKQLLFCPLVIPGMIENSTGNFIPLGALRFQIGNLFTQLIKVAFYYQIESYPSIYSEEFNSTENSSTNISSSKDKINLIIKKILRSSKALNATIPCKLSNSSVSESENDTQSDLLLTDSENIDKVSGFSRSERWHLVNDSIVSLDSCLLDYFDINSIQSHILSNQSISNLICEAIQKHSITKWFIDTFFEYPWHNLFHNLFCDFIYYILHWSLETLAGLNENDASLLTAGQSLLIELFTKHHFTTKVINVLVSPEIKSTVGYSEHLEAIINEIKDLIERIKAYSDLTHCHIRALILFAIEDQKWDSFLVQLQKRNSNKEETSLFGKNQIKKLFHNTEVQLFKNEDYFHYNSTDIHEDSAYNDNNSSDEYQFECSSDEEIYSPGDDNIDDQLSYLIKSTEIDENQENCIWHDKSISQEDIQELSDSYTPHPNFEYEDLNNLARSYSCDNLLSLGEEPWFNSKTKIGCQEHVKNADQVSHSPEIKAVMDLDSNLPEENFETIIL